MIEDREIRELFKAECEEHLEALEQGLLTLEAHPEESATLQAVFRAAHSLKGAARMLGIDALERVAHECEGFLGAVRRGQAVFSSEMADRLSPALDAIRRLAHEAVTGEAAGVDVESVLAQLDGEPPSAQHAARSSQHAAGDTAGRPASIPLGAACSELRAASEASDDGPRPPNDEALAIESEAVEAEISTEPSSEMLPAVSTAAPPVVSLEAPANGLAADLPLSASLVPPPCQPSPPERLNARTPERLNAGLPASPVPAAIDTVRVASQKLDALMALAGDLVVTTSRLRRGLAAFAEAAGTDAVWDKGVPRAECRVPRPDEAEGPATSSRGTRHSARGTGAKRPSQAARPEAWQETALARLQQATGDEMARLAAVADELEESIRKMRLLPLTTLFHLFPRLVRDLARGLQKEVRLIIEGGDTTADKRVIEEMKDPLMHMLRNAIDHGIEPPEEREARGKPREGTLTLRARQTATLVILELEDDGRGLDLDAIRRTALKRELMRQEELEEMPEEAVRALIFAPGFSTSLVVTDLSGRGVGMDVVRANVERLKGTIRVHSRPREGCTFQLQFPITLATTRVLLARVGPWTYAFPVEFVEGALLVEPENVFQLSGRQTISVQGRPVAAARLGDLLELPATSAPAPSREAARQRLPCILLSAGPHRLGLFVDTLLDEQEVVLKPLGGLLRNVRTVAGSTILGTGEVCMILDCQDLAMALRRQHLLPSPPVLAETVEPPRVVLLVDDAIATRVQEKRILEGAGYEVVTAVDGADAVAKLATRSFDAVVSDIEMPIMDGLALTARLRQDPRYREIPIILVTTFSSDEDRRRGIEAGASAYLTKGAFEQQVLLDTLRRLV